MKTKLTILITILLLFNACSAEKEYITPKMPKLRTCIVKPKTIKYRKMGNEICMPINSFKIEQNQNKRLRICNDLLNRQNRDFNKRFAK